MRVTGQISNSTSSQHSRVAPPNPNTEPGVSLFASAHDSGSIDLTANFIRTPFFKVLTPEFSDLSESAKQAIRVVAPLVGNVFDKNNVHIGGCLRVSEDTVMMPLHCAIRIEKGRIQFLTTELDKYTRCDVDSIIEL